MNIMVKRTDQTIGDLQETERQRAVRRYDILDSPPDGAFDRITAIAARIFGTPISIISIVDSNRIWFKSHYGLDLDQINRDPGLCATAILQDGPYIITDAVTDPRSMFNPLVTGGFGLRFYAGIPLQTSDGHNLGTLCVIDQQPRDVTAGQIADLADLASVVMDQIELRRAARKALDHADLMAKEIDHRMTNSLQFISSMLEMQSTRRNVNARTHLTTAANRVAAVAQVHRNFCTASSSQACCLTFLQRLCADLANILGRTIEVIGQAGNVPTTSIQPIGLIVNELVTNAAKHGKGKITVAYTNNARGHTLNVWDEGSGPSESQNPPAETALGMKIVAALTRQLRGHLSLTPRPNGVAHTITF